MNDRTLYDERFTLQEKPRVTVVIPFWRPRIERTQRCIGRHFAQRADPVEHVPPDHQKVADVVHAEHETMIPVRLHCRIAKDARGLDLVLVRVEDGLGAVLSRV